MRFYFLITFIFLSLASCNGSSSNSNNSNKANNNVSNTTPKPNAGAVPVYSYEIVKTYPHDGKAFTQGLVFHNGVFYEGTGGRKYDEFHSTLRKVEIESGKVLQKIDLAGDYFGEGITIFNDKIYQITWQEHTAFVYDLNFTLLKRFNYAGEGWGLAHDEQNLIMSDGTHVIRFINPETFETIRTIAVLDEKGKPIIRLNELEYIKGEIWANIWEEGWIIRIDPATGKLLGRIDLEKLADEQMDKDEEADVLNGIAYDETGNRIFITGKKWKQLFEIKLKDK
jgi:glutaminyl-peptide cyclotransferase